MYNITKTVLSLIMLYNRHVELKMVVTNIPFSFGGDQTHVIKMSKFNSFKQIVHVLTVFCICTLTSLDNLCWRRGRVGEAVVITNVAPADFSLKISISLTIMMSGLKFILQFYLIYFSFVFRLSALNLIYCFYKLFFIFVKQYACYLAAGWIDIKLFKEI